MNISVILCTFNRCDSLERALDSVSAQVNLQSADWEVVVVDNNSKDGTRTVAEAFCQRYPGRFRYVFEKEQGKSYALNTGIRESRGKILAFMDDDVIVEPDWLARLVSPLDDETWAGVGGRIVPPADFVAPSWLALEGAHNLGGILALFDKGEEGRELCEPPFGTNMAFRRDVFTRVGLFRKDLGPCPGSEIRGEDTEFGRRVLKSGSRLWYEPSAIVHHGVPVGRLTKRYFLRFQFDQGRASIREAGPKPPVGFIPRSYFTIPKLLGSTIFRRGLAWFFSTDAKRRFQRKCMVWMNLGQIAELLQNVQRGKGTAETKPPVLAGGTEKSA